MGENWCFRPQSAVKQKPWSGRVGGKEKEEEKGRLKGAGSRVGKERKGEEEKGGEQGNTELKLALETTWGKVMEVR